MTREEVLEKLNEIFKDVLELDELTLTDSTVADDVEGWDSLSHITLIATIERSFGIKFNMKEIVELHNVGELTDVILSKLA